jgi:hypothetical protein
MVDSAWLTPTPAQHEWLVQRLSERTVRCNEVIVPYLYRDMERPSLVRAEFNDGREPYLVEVDFIETTVTETWIEELP